ncbi:MAG: ParB/RepB/Spo0J family partition protein [Chloroflexota bacterium]
MAKRKRLDFGGVAEAVQIGTAAREILHKTVDDGVADLEMAKEIRLELIEPDPDQPRKHFDPGALEDLARSIAMQGVLQPIIVEWVPERERFRIISGERRWRATRLAGEWQAEAAEGAPRHDLSRIPAIIRNPSALDRYLQQVYENEQRQDYSDVERAIAYERLKESLGLTWEELAAKLGLSKGRIHQIRRTKNRLAPSVQRDITDGALTGRHGLYLAPLPEPMQELVASSVKEYHLTHDQTKKLVERLKERLVTAPQSAEPLALEPATAPLGEGAPPTLAATALVGSGEANLTERSSVLTGAPLPEEGVASYTTSAEQVVATTIEEMRAPRPKVPRAHRADLDKALALVRQLVQLDIELPATEADRDKWHGALSELQAWAEAQQSRLSAARAD